MKTLKDIIEFIQSRTDLANRDDVVREINNAWAEIWDSDDLPNSLFEISVKTFDQTNRITLPYYVDKIRGVKTQDRLRVDLNTPRPYYQDETYFQSPYLWRVLGTTPLKTSITNATAIKLSIAEAATEQFVVTLQGPTDNSTREREQIIFAVGDTEHWTTKNFTDLKEATKNKILSTNVVMTGANDEDYGIIPADAFVANNTVVQITDRCNKCCTACRCFDILYKVPAPYLYYDEQVVPFPGVLITKTLEWIAMPKEGQEQKAILYAEKSKALLTAFNHNDVSVEKKMDLPRNTFCTYTGSGYSPLSKI